MEIIIIKGESDIGKTTTAAMLHNELVDNYAAKVQWMMFDFGKFPLCEKDLTPDFRSVLKCKDCTIGIISHGDTSTYLRGFIEEMTKYFFPDILIICANNKENIWNMLRRKFGEHIKDGNIFEITSEQMSENISEKLIVKQNRINEIINRIELLFFKK